MQSKKDIKKKKDIILKNNKNWKKKQNIKD